MANRKLTVTLVGDTKGLSRAFGTAGRDASIFGRNIGAVHTRVSKSMAGMTLSIAKFGAATAGIGAIGAAFTKMGQATVGFDRAMRNVNSISQLSEKRLGALEKQVLSLAGKTAQAPQTLAEGLYDLVSSGFKANDAIKVLHASAKAATAGLTDTATSTKAVAAVLNAYHKNAKDANSVSDTLFQTVNRGVISFSELSTTIGDVLPFASSLGVPLKQVGAAISTMTKEGISAPETMTRLKSVMEAFIKPSKDMAAAVKQTGAESGEALVKQKGFQGALEATIKTTDGSKQSVAKLFPNIRALGGALALTGGNAQSAHKDLKAFSNTSGATNKALAQQSKSLSYEWGKITSTVSAVAIQVGSVVVPAVADGLKKVGGFIKGVGKTWDDLKAKFDNLTVKPKFSMQDKEMVGGGKSTLGALTTMFADAFKGIDWQGIGNTIGSGLSSVFNASGKLPALISQGLSQAFSHIDGRKVLGGLIDVLGGAIDALFSPSFWIDHFKAIFSLVTIVFPIGKLLKIPGLGFLFDKISKPLFNIAAKVGKGLVKILGNVAGDAIRGMAKGFSKEFPRATGAIGKLATKVIGEIKVLPTRLQILALDAGKAITKGLSKAAGAIGHAAGSLAGKAIKGLGSLASSFFSIGVKVGDRLTGGLVSKTGNMLKQVGKLGVKAVGALKSLPGKFFNLGKNVIQGLINGVKSLVGKATGAVTDVGKGIVGKFKGFFGIGSPSRKFHGFGQNLVQGLANGVASVKGLITKAMDKNVVKVIAASMVAGQKATRKGTGLISGEMVAALQNMGFSKKAALNLAKARASGSKQTPGANGELRPNQQGGYQTGGKPSGDSIPSLLERGEYVLNRKAVAKVGKRALDAINFRDAPRFQKGGGVGSMVAAANRVDSKHFPYRWGGGHQGSPAPFGPFDCSGAVSYVLQHGGVPIPTMVSGALANAGKPGPGIVTVFANAAHTFMRIGNRFFGTSQSNPGGGAGWMPAPSASYLAKFTQRHFIAGGAASVPRVLVKGPDSARKSLVQGALDKTRTGANRRLKQILQTAIGSGDANNTDVANVSGNGASLMKQIARQRGWNFSDWWGIDAIETHHGADIFNEGSRAWGRGQFLPQNYGKYGPGSRPGAPMGAQIQSMAQYIASRYGNPTKALAHEHAFGWYQRGGKIPGAGVGDRVPAMLEPGEFVLNRKAVAKVGAHRLAAMNAAVPRFQTGGLLYPLDARINALTGQSDALSDSGDSGGPSRGSLVEAVVKAMAALTHWAEKERKAGGGKTAGQIAKQLDHLQGTIDSLEKEKRNLPDTKKGTKRRDQIDNTLADIRIKMRNLRKDESAVKQFAGNFKQAQKDLRGAKKDLAAFDKEAAKTKKLAKINLKISNLQQLQTFRNAMKDIGSELSDLVDQAGESYRGVLQQRADAQHNAALVAIDNSPQAKNWRGSRDWMRPMRISVRMRV